MTAMSLRVSTAWHEAGHVVACFVLFGVAAAVDVRSMRDRDGAAHTGPARERAGKNRRTKANYRRAAIESLAGYLAEARATDCTLEKAKRYARSDLRHARLNALELLPKYVLMTDRTVRRIVDRRKLAALIARLEDEARALLDEHWRAVERVARALIRHGALDEQHVARLLAL